MYTKYSVLPILLASVFLASCGSDDDSCETGFVRVNGQCLPLVECKTGQHLENGVCVDDSKDEPKDECKTGQHLENGVCVEDSKDEPKDECKTGQHLENGVCVEDPPTENTPIDPCKNVQCAKGTCQQGVCITPEMIDLQNQAQKAMDDESGTATPPTCDTETFVEFCNGNVTVYCDQGMVIVGECDEGCVVYDETFHGKVRRQSGCIDGGACSQLDEIQRSCVTSKGSAPTVYAKACQKTATNELKYVSVDGYFCKSACDAKGEKCELISDAQGEECDPYDASNYQCDGKYLDKCYLTSALIGVKRQEYCSDACVQVGNIAMCGTACSQEGARTRQCVNADSTEALDSGDYVCSKADDGKLYSIWTRDYEICLDGCDSSSGKCLE